MLCVHLLTKWLWVRLSVQAPVVTYFLNKPCRINFFKLEFSLTWLDLHSEITKRCMVIPATKLAIFNFFSPERKISISWITWNYRKLTPDEMMNEKNIQKTKTLNAQGLLYRSSRPEKFLGKVVLKICSKFTGEHPCRSAISIKLQSNFIEITLRHGCSPVNLLHIFRTPFLKNTSGWLLLIIHIKSTNTSWRSLDH